MFCGVFAGDGASARAYRHAGIFEAGDRVERGILARAEFGAGRTTGNSFRKIVCSALGIGAGFATWRVSGADLCNGTFAGDCNFRFAAFSRAADGGPAGGVSLSHPYLPPPP